MPRYDYRCVEDACENDTFEVSKSYSDDSATVCPVCNNDAKKLLSKIAVHFKGSGFYVTDNRASNGASESSSDSSDSSDSSSESGDSGSKSESKKTESKSESKTDSSSKSDTPKPSGESKSKSKAASSSAD